MNLFRRILVATDFSPASTPAFEQAVRMAGREEAQLLIAHAYQEPALVELSHAPARVYEEWDNALREAVEKKLRPLVEHARKEGVEDARALLLAGFADEAIIAAAKEEGADLIVMGTHGRRGAARMFLGSVAARVISMASCPVMTVRSP